MASARQAAQSGQQGRARILTKDAAALALGTLAIACLLIALNAWSSQPPLVMGAEVLAGVALVSGLVSLASGACWAARSRPDLRRPLLFLFVLTVMVLGAHLYIVNSPATSTAGDPIVGPAGAPFSNSNLQISSSVVGTTLTVNLTNVGTNAVSSVTLSYNNVTVPSTGFSRPVTPADPLQPQGAVPYGYNDSVTGQWAVPAGGPGVIRASYQYLTCYHVPDGDDNRGVLGCIMDETYYVPAAQSLLAGTQCSTAVPNCNLEHPFLTKAMVAAGIAVFGLDTFGWRIFVVFLGTLCIPLIFVLTDLASGDRRLAYFASALMAVETLFFVHSSAALIDVPAVFFALVGFVLYFWKASYWKVDNLLASGASFGLAALSKETAVFLLAALVTYDWISGGWNPRLAAGRTARLALPALLVFAAGVQLYDSLFASAAYPYFFQQVSYMLSYGAGLKGQGWTDSTLHTFITPLNWLTFYSPVGYLVTTVTVTTGNIVTRFVEVGYYGVGNVVIVWMVYFWVPLAVYEMVRASRGTEAGKKAAGFPTLLVVWLFWTYVPYVLLWLYGRVTYPFYLVPAVPALVMGAGYAATRDWFPRRLAVAYVVFALAFFFLFFPVKDFLPDYVKAFLRW